MNFAAWRQKHLPQLQKVDGELRFADEVLARLEGHVDFAAVALQRPFVDLNGRRRLIDFTIEEGDDVRVAIEVDGWDKDGSGTGMNRRQFYDFLEREQGIVINDYLLVRYSNMQVTHDPRSCRESLTAVLDLARGKAKQIREARRQAERREQELREALLRLDGLQNEVLTLEAELAALKADGAGVKDIATKEQSLVVLRQAVVEGEQRRSTALLSLATEVLPATEVDRVAEVERVRERSYADELLLRLRKLEDDHHRKSKEIRSMKLVAASIAVVAVCAAVITALLSGREKSESPGLNGGGKPCDIARPWQQAASQIGSSGTFRGSVVSATYRERTNAKPTFLDIGKPFPDRSRLSLVIFGNSRSKFPKAPEKAYDDEEIAVTGLVEAFRGGAQIKVNSPSQIERC